MAEETKVNENVNFDGAYGYWHLREDGVLEWITADPHVQLTDLLFAPGFIKIDAVSGKVVDNGLSPNPDGSGYVKQVNTSALSNVDNPEENVLYVVGDRKFKYLKTDIVDPGTNKIIIPHGFNRVFAIPSLAQVKGVHGTPRKENVTPKEIPQVFPNPVAFLKDVFVKGKKLEDYIDAQGGVTEEELQTALATKQDKLVSGTNIKTVNGTSLLGSGNIDAINIEQIGTAQVLYQDNGGQNQEVYVKWNLTQEQSDKINAAKLIIFAMNGSFIITPLNKQNNYTLACGSFAYDTSGNSMLVRVRIIFSIDSFIQFNFDENFVEATETTFFDGVNQPPYAILMAIK